MKKRSLFFRLKWGRVLLILLVPLYVMGASANARRTAAELTSVAEAFMSVSAYCKAETEDSTERIMTVLDCGGAYDPLVRERDEIAHSRGCWNAASWKVWQQGRDMVKSTPIEVWCLSPWPF